MDLVPGFEAYTWHGIHAPAQTPEALVSEMNRVFNALLKRPEVLKRLEQQTALPVGGTPEEYGRFVEREIAKWSEVVKTSGITAN
jgi:tripartite-type tricarboxylate transporter receptor subunit TctC